MANACFSQNLGHRWSVVIIPAPKSFSTSHVLASKHHALAYASIELSSDSPQVKGEEPCRPSSPGPHAQKMTGAIIPESDSFSYVSNRCTIIRLWERASTRGRAVVTFARGNQVPLPPLA